MREPTHPSLVDYIYTGQFEESQSRECLMELMRLAHRWEVADVQAKAEALLVPTMTPGNYRERMYPSRPSDFGFRKLTTLILIMQCGTVQR